MGCSIDQAGDQPQIGNFSCHDFITLHRKLAVFHGNGDFCTGVVIATTFRVQIANHGIGWQAGIHFPGDCEFGACILHGQLLEICTGLFLHSFHRT